MMGTNLQQLLRSLCLDAGWDYAVFWKLKHRARMVLTWEDAYCHSHANIDHRGSKCNEHLQSFHDGQLPRDPLGSAVAKMSYHVYSFGEGIVGQVAATGKHEWIVVDKHSVNPLTSSEHCDGWQAQFLAGIQTVVVAAVIPHGVVQLGSLGKVHEDPKLLTHLRDLFSVVHDASAGHVSNSAGQSFPTLLPMSDMSLAPEVHPGYSITLSVPFQKEDGGLHTAPLPGYRETLTRKKRVVSSVSENAGNVKMVNPGDHKRKSKELVNYDTVQKAGSPSLCDSAEPQSSYGAAFSAVKPGVESDYSSSQSFDQRLLKEVGKDMGFQSEDSILDALMSSCNLSTGYELHEALGPAFLKQGYPRWWEVEKCEPANACEIAEGMEPAIIKSVTGSDNLLEAVVAEFCHKGSGAKIVKPTSTSVDSLLTNEVIPEASNSNSHTVGSVCYSIDSSILEESTQHCLTSSESYDMRSFKGFSSSSPSSYQEQFSRQSEPTKGNKKRSRGSENYRPRPRDRQLIQDRIKELRELVPNGSKCSIDSLLERTVKHMLFLQCITKHADKLNKCARSRVSNDSGISGCSNHEQGASWAVEVGSNMKTCSIVVENLNMNGQMLIEMLCEDCDNFLEAAEAIRGLSLIILKGITESDGDKTRMRFVVEGQNSGNMRRMDVLWSLVQTLQKKAANH